MKDKHQKDLEKILNSEVVKSNLIKGSIFLTAYEMLNYSIVERTKSFLCITAGFNENLEQNISQEYRDIILNRRISELNNNKNVFYSSCLWIQENGGITEGEVTRLQVIRRHRNKIAHELPLLMLDSDHEINVELFDEIKRILGKVDKWWVIEFEIPTNSDFDSREFTEMDLIEIKSGQMIMIDYLVEIVKNELNK